MRQGQNNKRSRGRPNNNRKPQSGRTLDSNGPDVKIRGTAAHIYEKYQSLARDAQASGDRIVAENYLQHAEHYYRVMLAAEGSAGLQNRVGPMQQRPPQPGVNGQHGETSESGEQPAADASNGQSHYGNDRQPPARARSPEETDRQEQPREHGHGNGQSNGRSTAHTDEPVAAKPDASAPTDAPVSTEAKSTAPEQTAETEAGNGREQPRRRGRPPREREEVAAAPAAETETGPETPESVG